MNLSVCTALFMNILSNYFLVAVLTDGIGIIPTRPELSTPEHFFDFWMTMENLPRSNALDSLHDCGGGQHGDTLDQKMDMVFIRPDLHKMDLVTFSYFDADLFEGYLHLFRKHFPSVLCRTDNVVEQQRLVMPFKYMFAHPRILPLSWSSQPRF
jgi:hypothetical protein